MRFPQILFNKADGDGGGGGGAGGDPGGGDQKPFTEDQIRAIGGMISGAFKNEGKRLIQSTVTEAIGGLKIGETIATEIAKLKETPGSDPSKGAPGGTDGKPDPKVSALEATVQQLKTQLQTEAEDRKKAEESARNEKTYTTLLSELTPHVRPEALELAARDLFVGQKRVTFDEQGNALFTVRRATYTGGPEEDVAMPLKEGVSHWAKSNEGKFFAPAPTSGGDKKGPPGPGARRVEAGGDGLPRYDTPATTDAEKLRRAQERETILKEKYPHLA
jgi:hypothetical protein